MKSFKLSRIKKWSFKKGPNSSAWYNNEITVYGRDPKSALEVWLNKSPFKAKILQVKIWESQACQGKLMADIYWGTTPEAFYREV